MSGITLGPNIKKRYQRQFEIPYNFDKNLITALKALGFDGQESYSLNTYGIYCIYVAPFIEDTPATVRSSASDSLMNNLTREEYEEHLTHINEVFPGSIQLLLNKNDSFLDSDKILYYHNKFNVNMFCVNNDEQGKIIKGCVPNAKITASITMCLSKEDIDNLDEHLYDNVVLYFPFNKDYEGITNLPKKFNYILLANSFCDISCDGCRHWNLSRQDLEEGKLNCPRITSTSETAIMIRPMDLKYFDDYIFAYKLQDRDWPTLDIIQYAMLALSDNYFNYMQGIEPFNADKFYSLQGCDINANS